MKSGLPGPFIFLTALWAGDSDKFSILGVLGYSNKVTAGLLQRANGISVGFCYPEGTKFSVTSPILKEIECGVQFQFASQSDADKMRKAITKEDAWEFAAYPVANGQTHRTSHLCVGVLNMH